jgi:hypothetical protein
MDHVTNQSAGDAQARCTTCGTRIQATEPTQACADCGQTYHKSCWDEVGGCATFGCARAPVAGKPAAPSSAGAGWGDFKNCPQCHSRIGSSLLVCTCGASFPYAAPMTSDQYGQWTADLRSAKGLKLTVLMLFVLSLTGVLAPILGPASYLLVRHRRKLLEGADGAFAALALGNLVVGVTYALVFVMLIVGK